MILFVEQDDLGFLEESFFRRVSAHLTPPKPPPTMMMRDLGMVIRFLFEVPRARTSAPSVRDLYIANSLNIHIGRGILRKNLWIQRVVTLAHKNGGDASAPDLFDGCEDSQFVIDEHIVMSGVAALDVFEFLFFVNVNHGLAFDRFQ
jgi:hypothetical protein